MKWFEIESRLAEAGPRIFSAGEFRRLAGVGPVAAKFLLIRYTRRGLLRRLKRGLYAAASRPPSPWSLANRLYRPSYISLASALSYYGLIPESVYAVTSVTTRTTREFSAADALYLYRTVKNRAFRGYRSAEIGGETVLLAEKEKALADYLYFVFLKKERLNARLKARGADRRLLEEHIAGFGNGRFLEWFKNDFKIADNGIKF